MAKARDSEAFCFYCRTKGHWEETCWYKENNIPKDEIVRTVEIGEAKDDEGLEQLEKTASSLSEDVFGSRKKKRKTGESSESSESNPPQPLFIVQKRAKNHSEVQKEDRQEEGDDNTENAREDSERREEHKVQDKSNNSAEKQEAEEESGLSLLLAYSED